MLVEKLRNLVEGQILQVQLAQSLLQRPRAMRDNLYNLGDKRLVGRDVAVPALHKLAQDDGEQGVELEIDVVAACQGREELVDGRLRVAALSARLLRAQRPPDERLGRAVRQRVGGGRVPETRRAGSGRRRSVHDGGGGRGHGRRVAMRRAEAWHGGGRGTAGTRVDVLTC